MTAFYFFPTITDGLGSIETKKKKEIQNRPHYEINKIDTKKYFFSELNHQ